MNPQMPDIYADFLSEYTYRLCFCHMETAGPKQEAGHVGRTWLNPETF